MFRLPWSSVDHPNGWLEPTTACNLSCQSCYRRTHPATKDLATVQRELDEIIRIRNCDHIAIAGGEPLLVPHLEDMIREIKRRGQRCTVLTNGMLLTAARVRSLREAGLDRLTIHVDAKQGRPGWENRSEEQMNELRQSYADLLQGSGIQCGMIATVFEDTIDAIPAVLQWGVRNAGRVAHLTFDLFRFYPPAKYVRRFFDSQGRSITADELYEVGPTADEKVFFIEDLTKRARQVYPDFTPHSFLNGTVVLDKPKWLLATPVFQGEEHLGYLGWKSTRLVNFLYHLRHNRYPSFVGGKGVGLLGLLLLSGFDPQVRRVLGRWLLKCLARPLRLFQGIHTQSIAFIQPPDWDATGTQNLCDACPDAILHEGRLVPSCRLDEHMRFGGLAGYEPEPGAWS